MAVFVVSSVRIRQIRAFYDDCTAQGYTAREPVGNNDVNATKQDGTTRVYDAENKADNILRALPNPQQKLPNRFHRFAVQYAIGNSARTSKHGHCFIHSFFEILPSPFLSVDASRWPITSLIVGYSSINR